MAKRSKMKLVIFADYGLDDACATVYVLKNRSEFDEVDIVPIGGNVEAERAYKNACKLLNAAALDGIPLDGVRLVDTADIEQPFCRLPSVHGDDGMGDLFADCAPCVSVLDFDEWVRSLDCEYKILSLGPCTVVCKTLELAPRRYAGDMIIMGGCVSEEPNYKGYEFNDGLDHAAFVRALGYPHKAATLDTCRADTFNYINKRFDGGDLLSKLMSRSVSLASKRHNDRCYIYDYIAALALLHPEAFDADILPYLDSNALVTQLKVKRGFFL